MNADEILKLPVVAWVACEACAGKGVLKQWIEGKPHTAHMGRCEQCSGFGKVRA